MLGPWIERRRNVFQFVTPILILLVTLAFEPGDAPAKLAEPLTNAFFVLCINVVALRVTRTTSKHYWLWDIPYIMFLLFYVCTFLWFLGFIGASNISQ
ncbi:hypothetical protein DES52_12231 [Deinococcus yavapaiensis KR-236]|uniref:Uncharacterized protein n=2 Tax=Deinococcus TaxID=1298 RepID=A0A318S3Y2_9DEIO|nr:hypothetical protein DES52_12231 [Deinococcus yavapaiensis KR-236]